jgi:hypothetical protein
MSRPSAAALAGLLASIGLGALRSAGAEDPKEATVDEVAALEGSIAQHKKDKDSAGLKKDLEAIPALHRTAAEGPARDRVNALFGAILQATKDQDVEITVLKTIGEVGDEANWKHVRRFLVQPDEKVVPPMLLPAMEAARRIKATGAVEPMLKIVQDSKDPNASAAAIRALGGYGENRKVRARVLEEIVKIARKAMPSRGGAGGGKSGGDTSRWEAIGPAFIEAANALTGKNLQKPDEWFDLMDRYKGKLDPVFEK